MSTPATSIGVGTDATWAAQPPSGDWNSAANWTPADVPTDTATFGPSSQATIGFGPDTSATVADITFAPGAPSYTFVFEAPAPDTPALTIAGDGISNGSTNPQRFVVASSAVTYRQEQLKFANAATAGESDVFFFVGPAGSEAAGGGVVGFYDQSTAGAATFTVTTGAGTPEPHSTVGGEVSFSDDSSAGTAHFTVYGSTSLTDGDTFGNVVFHDSATAADAAFTNVGGTVAGGDGGNTQFYNDATAANGTFHNMGATVQGANGGDVAFDGTANAANGLFQNYAAAASGGYGGVTSFNNNPPALDTVTSGASAGSGQFFNHGASAAGQGGGHTFFTAKYGSPTAAQGTFVNYGSAVAGSDSCAGHTVLSISLPQKAAYCPDAGSGTFWNFPGTVDGAPGGYTEFAVYTDQGAAMSGSDGPRGGSATFINLAAFAEGASGGSTVFSGTSNAENAKLIATGGTNGAAGGSVVFSGKSSGGAASVHLSGNGTLDLSGYDQPTLTIGDLELAPGCIRTTLGTLTPCLVLSGKLALTASPAAFYFETGPGFSGNTWYTILTAPNLPEFTAAQFTGNSTSRGAPAFRIAGNELQVSFA